MNSKTDPPAGVSVSAPPGPQKSLGRRVLDSFKQDPRFVISGEKKNGNGRDVVEDELVLEDSRLRRSLKSRHMQMIAIGGSIGTGLFIGSGLALSAGGPAAMFIVFLIVGIGMFNVVQAMGELAVLFPIEGSFSVYCTRFIDPALGFATGWCYSMLWLVVLPIELTAAGMVIEYWKPGVNTGVFITVLLVFIILVNLCGVRGYGEAEFFISLTKVIAVLSFIILGIVINLGGAPKGGFRGVKTWTDPGGFNNGFKGFCSVLVTAAFSFGGTEIVGIAAAESANPRSTLSRACKQIFWRISFFYIASLTIVGFLVPYNEPRLLSGTSQYDSNASPFVIAIEQAGISVLPSIFNGVILFSVISVGISSTYASSRMLAAMAKQGQAPKIFAYIDRKGRPLFSLALAFAIGLLAYINLADVGTKVFSWLVALSGLGFFFAWLSICLAHIRFRAAWKAQGNRLEDLPFRAVFGVVGSWIGLIIFMIALLSQFYIAVWPLNSKPNVEKFFQSYLTVPIVIICYIGWKIGKKTKVIPLKDVDLVTGRREFNLAKLREDDAAERRTWSVFKRVYRRVC